MKESTLSIVAFVSLLAVFCIVALTASWSDEGADDQVGDPGSAINASGAGRVSTQSPINHFSENGKEPESDAACSSPTNNDADGQELATAYPNYRVNYHRKDADKNDREDAADIVE